MGMRADDLYSLLPAYLHVRDAIEGQHVKGRVAPDDSRNAENFRPLRTLVSLIAREGQIVEESIDQLYDDAFIETCAPWVIPYLGDLLGVRGLEDIPEGIDMRARVADALSLRARKGTLRALEHASSQASNWPVFAVEYWKKLIHAQSMRLTHPNQGRSVDMRNKPALARIGTAFERDSRTFEARRIDSMGGRWNLGNIGLYVWRLKPYRITGHAAREIGSRRAYRFHPLGCDAPLFDQVGVMGGVDMPAAEDRMPVPITRAVMTENVSRFYGPGKAIGVTVGNEVIPPDKIKAAHLGDLPGNGSEPPWNHESMENVTLIDPELGRVVVDRNLSGPVRLTCHFARPLELGGGEHARVNSIDSIDGGVTIPPSAALVTRINSAGGAGTFLLDRSTQYTATGVINVPAGESLRIIATDGHFPTLRLTGVLRIALGAGARVELNGIRLYNNLLRITGRGAGATLRDCTLCPGRGLTGKGEPTDPGATALAFNSTGGSLLMERTISGPVRLATDVDARFAECIIDASAPGNRAIFAPPSAERHVIRLDRCTIWGQVETDAFGDGKRSIVSGFGVEQDSNIRLATSDTIFASSAVPAIAAARRQVGCIRFSYVPPGSNTPRLYRCTQDPAPVFTSLRYADPDYLLLARSTGDSIRRGAENGGEIGAYNRAAHTVRRDNIRRTISDFLRFGHAAGIFDAT